MSSTSKVGFARFSQISLLLIVFFFLLAFTSHTYAGEGSIDSECQDYGFDYGVSKWQCEESNLIIEEEAYAGTTVTGNCEKAQWNVGSSGADGIIVKASTLREATIGTSGTATQLEGHNISHITFCGFEGAEVIAHKIVCEEEEDLPDWVAGGIDITSETAQDYVDSHPGCDFAEGWIFQWAGLTTPNPGDNRGEVGNPWTSFGPTDLGGKAATVIGDLDSFDDIWVREALQEGYIGFTYNTPAGNSDDYSAEIYCHTDVGNYDNFDSVESLETGETYYCVAFNALESMCGNGVLDEGEECDGGDGCSPNCKITNFFFECDNIDIAANGVGTQQTMPQTLSLTVPGNPLLGLLYWGFRGAPDEEIIVNGETINGTLIEEPVLGHVWWSQTYTYLSQVDLSSGLNQFEIDGFNKINADQSGAALLAVYEEPKERNIVQIKSKNNFVYYNIPVFEDSNVVTFEIEPADYNRTTKVIVIVGDSQGGSRGDAIWYTTGTGTPPTANVIGTGILLEENQLVGADGPEMDTFEDTLVIPARHTYLSLQLDSPLPYGDSATLMSVAIATECTECQTDQDCKKETCKGDANGDGVVDEEDYVSVQANFGRVCIEGVFCEGDADKDGVVTMGDVNIGGFVSAGDYATVQANFGKICTGNQCTTNSCINYTCVETPKPLSTSCEADGDLCSIDHCDGAGSCVFLKSTVDEIATHKIISEPKVVCDYFDLQDAKDIECLKADINQNGKVDISDLALLAGQWGRTYCRQENNWCDRTDINQDGEVENVGDLNILSENYGREDCNASNNWCDRADINQDGNVDVLDLTMLANNWGRTGCSEQNNWCNGADINRDGKVDDSGDLDILAKYYGKECNSGIAEECWFVTSNTEFTLEVDYRGENEVNTFYRTRWKEDYQDLWGAWGLLNLYQEPFVLPEDSIHELEYYSVDSVCDANELAHYEIDIVDNQPPLPNKIVGEPNEIWDGKDSIFYPEIKDLCWNGQEDEMECWKVTLTTPIDLGCVDQEPHPVEQESVCFYVELDGDNATEDYCSSEEIVGDYNANGDGYCCRPGTEKTFYFQEETEHNLKYYCIDALGNTSPIDDEKFKVEGKKFQIKINKKWNLISVPFAPIDNSIEKVLENIIENVSSVWTYDAMSDQWFVYHPESEETSNLKTMEPGPGYWLAALEEDILTIGGNLFSPATTPASRSLKAGFNLIGYYGTDDLETYNGPIGAGRTAACALYSLGSSILDKEWTSLLTYWEQDNPNQWTGFGQDNRMDPGAGYWISVPEDGIYSYTTIC